MSNPFLKACAGVLKLPLVLPGEGNSEPEICDEHLGDSAAIPDDALTRHWYGLYGIQTSDLERLRNRLKDHGALVCVLPPSVSLDGTSKQNVLFVMYAGTSQQRWRVRPTEEHNDITLFRAYDELSIKSEQTRTAATDVLRKCASNVADALSKVEAKVLELSAMRMHVGGDIGFHLLQLQSGLSPQDDVFLVLNTSPLETVYVPPIVRRGVMHAAKEHMDQHNRLVTEVKQARDEYNKTCEDISDVSKLMMIMHMKTMGDQLQELNTAKDEAVARFDQQKKTASSLFGILRNALKSSADDANDDTDDD